MPETKKMFGSLAIEPKAGVSSEQIKDTIVAALNDLGHVTFIYVGDDNPPPQPPPQTK